MGKQRRIALSNSPKDHGPTITVSAAAFLQACDALRTLVPMINRALDGTEQALSVVDLLTAKIAQGETIDPGELRAIRDALPGARTSIESTRAEASQLLSRFPL